MTLSKNNHLRQLYGITLHSWQAKGACLLFSRPLQNPVSVISVASENSWRAAISFTAVVGATHILLSDKWDPDILKDLKTLPKPTVEVIMAVSKAWGDSPVFPVKPAYIYSTDETTQYAYEGTRIEKGKFVLVTKKSVAKSGTQALYNCDDNKSMSGMRLKLTFTFSALGAAFHWL